jgi:hypothetical protein
VSGSRLAPFLAGLLVALCAGAVTRAAPAPRRPHPRPTTGAVRITVIATLWSDVGELRKTRALAACPVRLLAAGERREATTDEAGVAVFARVPTGRAVASCLIGNADPDDPHGWEAETLWVRAGRTTSDTLRPPITNAKRPYR